MVVPTVLTAGQRNDLRPLEVLAVPSFTDTPGSMADDGGVILGIEVPSLLLPGFGLAITGLL